MFIPSQRLNAYFIIDIDPSMILDIAYGLREKYSGLELCASTNRLIAMMEVNSPTRANTIKDEIGRIGGVKTVKVNKVEPNPVKRNSSDSIQSASPSFGYAATVMNTTTAIKDGLTIGDALVIKTEANKITFLTQGDVSKVEGEVIGQDLTINGLAQSKYPLDCLKKLKFDTDEIKIEFGNDYPMKISWGDCFVVLAPRVSEEV